MIDKLDEDTTLEGDIEELLDIYLTNIANDINYYGIQISNEDVLDDLATFIDDLKFIHRVTGYFKEIYDKKIADEKANQGQFNNEIKQ